MDNSKPAYKATQNARGCLGIFVFCFTAFLSAIFIFSGSFVFNIIGYLLTLLVIASLYSIIQNDKWVFCVEEEKVYWNYSRWPNETGELSINDISNIIIDDCEGKIVFTFKDKSEKNIKLIGYGYKLKEFFKKYYQQIELEYIEDT